jgi:hypothetical protein
MTAAHSHNDYEQRRPLLDSLALGYRSVEAEGESMKRAAVTVILTGDEQGKQAYTAGPGASYAYRDSNDLLVDEKRDPLHLWYALSWTDWFSWDGQERMPSAERNRLRALVDAVHRLGRRLRLYRLPEVEDV